MSSSKSSRLRDGSILSHSSTPPTTACTTAADIYPTPPQPKSSTSNSTSTSSNMNGSISTGGSTAVTASPNPGPLKRRKVEGGEGGGDTTTTAAGGEPSAFSLLNPSYAGLQTMAHAHAPAPAPAPAFPSAACPLFTLLSEDLLVLICEFFPLRELARLDRVGRVFRALLNLPSPAPGHPPLDASFLHGHAANFLWRNAALSAACWPFPPSIDREHLERVVLRHLRHLPPRAGEIATAHGGEHALAISPITHPHSQSVHPPSRLSVHAHAGVGELQSSMDVLGEFGGSGSGNALHHANVAAMPPSITNSHSPLLGPISGPHRSIGGGGGGGGVSRFSASASSSHLLPPLNWRSILASVMSREAARGKGTLVLDMGSCTVSVGLGGPDAGVHGVGKALPVSFPAIALNDLVGDQIGSASVRSINPVSSISMPILHANETGEFSYCSPIWKYALQRVPEEKYCGGKPAAAATTATAPAAAAAAAAQPSSLAAAPSLSPSPLSPLPTSPSPSPSPTPSLPPSLLAAQAALSFAAAAAAAASSDASGSGSNSNSDGGTVLVCDQLLGSKLELAKKRAKVARILFSLQPPHSRVKLAFCNESFLSLLNTGKTTGVVLHVGFSRSTCAIFVNGRIQNLSSLPTRMVGGHIHSRIMLQALFSRRQFQPAVADMFAVIPMLKEQCYCAADTAEEQQKPREVTHVEITITDKKLTLGHERFTSSDVFFLYGFPAMVVEALQSSPAWPVLQRPSPVFHPAAHPSSSTPPGYPSQVLGGAANQSMAFAAGGMILPPQPGAGNLNLGKLSPLAQANMEALSSSALNQPGSRMLIEQDGSAAEANVGEDQLMGEAEAEVEADESMSDVPGSSISHHSTSRMVNRMQAQYAVMQSTSSTYTGTMEHAVAFPSNAVQARATQEESQHAAGLAGAANGAATVPASAAPAATPVSVHAPAPVPAPSTPIHMSSSSSDGDPSALAMGSSMLPSTAGQDNEEDEPHQLIKTLLQSIVLSGRSTSLRGFAARFERDLNAILKQNTPAKVHENHVECSWLGGSVLSSLSIFPALAITREEFVQDGINAILRHMEI